MTSKETIKEFEHLLKVEKDRIHKDVVFITALENAIEALEKQIPKKPRKEKYFYGKIYYCPLCKKSIGKEAFVLTSSCQSCGQTLDWSDENK